MPGRTSCVASNYSDFELPDNDVLVEVTQVMQPVCSTLTTLDITGKQFSNGFKFFLNSYADSLLTAEDFWFFLRSLPTIHNSHQSLEQMH